MIDSRSLPNLTRAQRREVIAVYAWAPWSKAQRLKLCAAVIGMAEETFMSIVEADASFRKQMETASRAAEDQVYAALRDVAQSSLEARAFLAEVAPEFGRRTRST
jgi:hypothetical protein